ncbi:MAG TPA: hypothetical protein VM925_13335 [Labilithrix sp.]|nr:hypothetical protein [Labilithrix sp.]
MATVAVVAVCVLTADPAHRWTRRIRVNALPREPGQVMVHPPDIDERELKLHLLRGRSPQIVLLGSSRVMSVTAGMFGASKGTVLNLGVSGASAEDYVAFWQALKESGELPQKVVVYVDPWVFNKNRDQSRWVTNRALVGRFLEESGAGLVTRATIAAAAAKARSDEVTDLLSWVSLRSAGSALVTGSKSYEVRLTDESSMAPTESGTRWDGSHVYEERRRKILPIADIEQLAREYALAPTVYSLRDFEPDAQAHLLVRALFESMTRSAVDVLVVMPPYQPTTLELMRERPATRLALETYARELEQLRIETHVAICNALDPATSACGAAEFMDGMHPLPSCNEKVLRGCLSR